MTVELVPLRGQNIGRRALSIRGSTCFLEGTIMTLVSHGYESTASASATRSINSGAPARPAKRFAGGSIFPCAVGAPFLLIRLQLVCACAAITVRTGVGQTATVSAPYLTGQVPDPTYWVGVVVVVVLLPLVPTCLLVCPPPPPPPLLPRLLACSDWPQSSVPRKKVQALGEPAPRRSPSIPSPQSAESVPSPKDLTYLPAASILHPTTTTIPDDDAIR